MKVSSEIKEAFYIYKGLDSTVRHKTPNISTPTIRVSKINTEKFGSSRGTIDIKIFQKFLFCLYLLISITALNKR